MYPNLKEKTTVFYNIIDERKLETMTVKSEGFNDQFNGTRILTVGRLTSQKGQDIIPRVLIKLKAEGINVRWYCLGDGENRSELQNLIKKHNLEEYFILLGIKNNPYPYVKECDIYVQLSRHEGYCITLAEARAFNKPIVTTDFVGAREQIEHGENGLITKFDEKELFSAIKVLIENVNLRYEFENNFKKENVNTTSEIKKLNDCFR
ncbi:hypothetical protein COJ92_12155 [Priestia megaterium]|nr:glycosyltransferase [Priestia megaterium]MDR4217752.1 glycosyltransferase [Priestia megaterium]PFP18288.1 hypothetical protein COJ92_12155 [Priestia megaterium]PFU55884.1 hypothetical protein COK90_23285 [Priestia megaterium]PGH73703.1 hypothetical protein CN890_05165 [Priestia megaterium]